MLLTKELLKKLIKFDLELLVCFFNNDFFVFFKNGYNLYNLLLGIVILVFLQ